MRKKELANQRVIRAITLGLATFMALQSPMAVLAEDGTTQDPTPKTQQSGNENGEAQQQTVPEIEAVKDAAEIADKEDKNTPGAAQLIDAAQQAVETAEPTPAPVVTEDNTTGTTPVDPAADLKTDLATAGTNVDNAKSELDNAASYMQQGVDGNNETEKIADGFIANIGKDFVTIQVPKADDDGNPVFEQELDENGNPKVDEQGAPVYVQAVDEEGKPRFDEDGNPIYKQETVDQVIVGAYVAAEIQTSSDADSAIQNATIANTNSDENTARKAKIDAEQNLTNSETELGQAKQAVKNAGENVSKIEAELAGLYDKAQKAQENLQNAQTALDYAGTDAATAVSNMEAAQGEVERLQGELQTAYQNMYDAGLEEIQAQVDLINTYVEGKKAEGKGFQDQYYWDETIKLCNMIIKSYILNKEGISIVQIGKDFSVNLITDYEPDGDPAPRLGKEGDLVNDDGYIVDENGNVLLFQAYKGVTGTFVEKANENIDGWIKANNNQDNRVVVTYTKTVIGDDGEEKQETVEEYYNYKANDDGSIYVYQRSYKIDDNGAIILDAVAPAAAVEGKAEVPYQRAEPAQEAVPASWKTGDSEDAKVFAKTETTHMVSRDSNEEISEPGENDGGFWAIDTNNEPKSTETKSYSEVVDLGNNKTRTYEAVPNTETVRYEHVTNRVVTGYQKKSVNEHAVSAINLYSEISNLLGQGYEVNLMYKHTGDKEYSTISVEDMNIFRVAWSELRYIFTGHTNIKISTNAIDDLDNPIMGDEEDIYEIRSQEFKEVITTSYTINTKNSNTYKKEADADSALEDAKNTLLNDKDHDYVIDEAYTDWTSPLGFGLLNKKYFYIIKYHEAVKSETSTPKVIQQKVYVADTYTSYDPGKPYVPESPEVPYQAAVEAKPAVIGRDAYKAQKVVWVSDNQSIADARANGTMVESSDYLQLINDYTTKRSELDAKIKLYESAKTAVNKAKDRVDDLNEQIAKLGNVEYNDQKLIELETLLKEAKNALNDAKAREVELEKKVNDARAAVNSIDLSRFDQVPGDDDDTPSRRQPGGPGAGGFGGFTFETPATPGDAGAGGAGGAGGDGGATGGTAAGTVAGTQTANAGTVAGAGAGAGGNGVLGARTNNTGRGGRVVAGAGVNAGNGGDEVTTIDDGKTALAGSIETAKPQDSDDTTKKADTVTIQDTEPAKAAFDDVNDQEASHTWLWWILALLAGAVTLEEFIRRQRNKAQVAENSASGSAHADNKPVD